VRVAIVSGICIERDAISAAAVEPADSAQRHQRDHRVDLFAGAMDRPVGVPHHVVPDAWQLVRHPAFRAADVVLFHWGIRYPMFEALTLLAGGGPRPVIVFHNLTPAHLVDPGERKQIEASAAQLEHALSMDPPVWTFSEENRRALHDLGVGDDRIRFVPFAVTAPRAVRDRRAPVPLRLLTIGRVTAAKGTDVLIEAVGMLAARMDVPIDLDIVGNPRLSDAAFAAALQGRIDELDIGSNVRIEPGVDEPALWDRLESAHILVCPSLHEGLCVPVIEAYIAGCRVVVSDGGNLPHLVRAPDEVVPAGDPGALASAIERIATDVTTGKPVTRPFADAVQRLYGTESADRHLHAALDELVDPIRASARPWPTLISGGVPQDERLRAST